MAKRLDITPEIETKLKTATGDAGLDVSKLAVFETILADTRPINKRGSLFDRGRLSTTMLGEMEAFLAAGKTVPVQIMHNSEVLPVGRVVSAWMNNLTDGETELRGLFYLPLDRAQLVADIESSVIDSVSIGAKSAKILCSECGWDYLGADASFNNLWERTCLNEHTVGEKGVHCRMIGLDTWYETSLVNAGGVPRAKIQPRQKAQASERLAASGIPLDMTVLSAAFRDPKKQPQKESTMDLMTLVTANAEAAVALAAAKTSNETLTTANAALTATNTELSAKVTDLTAQLAAAPNGAAVTELNTKLEAANTELAGAQGTVTSVTTFLRTQAEAALVASGGDKALLSDDPTALMKIITDAGLKLHQLIGSEGTSQSSDANRSTETETKLSAGAFKSRR